MYKFNSMLLNEELNKHNLSFCKDIRVRKVYEILNNIEGSSVMVRVFPNEEKDYFYDRKLKDKMIYRLKREGFKFTSFNGMEGYYIKPLQKYRGFFDFNKNNPYICNMNNLIKCLFKKKKNMNKFKVGDKVRLQPTPKGKLSSGNTYRDQGLTFVIEKPYTNPSGSGYYIMFESGGSAGYVYEYEMRRFEETKEEIIEEIEELQSQIDCLKSKLDWMDEVGVYIYDENEFKIYETLKTLENGELGIKEKTKLIVSLIKGNNC